MVLDRARENRSQLVFTQGRGRDAVFWQSARTRKQARPSVRTPTARAHGIEELQIVVDAHEQYPYRFATQNATTVRRALPCGDYGLDLNGQLVGQTFHRRRRDQPQGRQVVAAADEPDPVVAAALQNTAGIVGAAVAAQVDRAESARSGRSECTLSLQWSKAAAGPDSGEYP